ncbi:MAG: hypothetical protein FWD27_02470 [Coriobacteriia bacterium]|nr:hypothetical protein [Coriobacteriia bacterium]
MLKMRKAFCAVFLSIVLVSASMAPAMGLGIQNVLWGRGPVNWIQTCFIAGMKGTGAYGTDPRYVVKQAYVRQVEGRYDSGRYYSFYIRNGGGYYVYTPQLSKFNDPWNACYLYYGWLY